LSQVIADELFQVFFVAPFSADAQVVLDELNTIAFEDGSEKPEEEIDATGTGHEDHPVPEEYVDFFVEQVERKYALQSVPMNVGHVLTSDLEVAKSDSRKGDVTFLQPSRLVLHHLVDNVEAKGIVLR